MTEADITAALDVLRQAGWEIRTHTGRGKLLDTDPPILMHPGPSYSAMINADPQAYGLPAGTVVVDEVLPDYEHRSASEPWHHTPATVGHQEDTRGPDTADT